MPLFDTDDGLIVTQEGTCARARCGRLNFLFRDRSAGAVLDEYRESVARVRSWFRPRRDRLPPEALTEDEFAGLTKEIALHWMYFYIVNQMPVDVTDADMDHPQSKHIFWSFLCGKHGERSSDVPRTAAAMTGMSQAEFEQWLTGWKRYLDR